MNSLKARLVSLLCIVAGALVVLAPAAINRAPFLFFDTAIYFETGQAVWRTANISPSEPTRDDGNGTAIAEGGAKKAGNISDVNESMAYVGGRSPYYSSVLVLIANAFGLWGAVFLQALCGSYLSWRVLALTRPPLAVQAVRHFGLLLALTIGSTLPYFAGFLMPDVFAGYAIVAMVLLFAPAALLPLGHRVIMLLIAAFSILAHTTNIALAGLTLLAAVIVIHWATGSWRDAVRRVRWSAAALVLGLVGAPVFSLACQIVLGDTPHRPPYLLARVIADGPGRLYLEEACRDPDKWAICAFRNQRLDDHNAILWSRESDRGVLQLADYPTKLRLKAEERSFVFAAIKAYPVIALGAAWRNAIRQLRWVAIGYEFGMTRDSWHSMVKWAIPNDGPLITRSLSYGERFPYRVTDAVQIVALLLSLCWLGGLLLQADMRAAWRKNPASRDQTARRYAIGLIFAVIAILATNAVLCGVLSGPAPRYQGRLTWLVPALALVLIIWRREIAASKVERSDRQTMAAFAN